MPFLDVDPEHLTAAAGSLSGVGDSMAAGLSAGAAPTTGVMPPAVHPVSLFAASHLSTHGQLFQEFSAQAEAAHQHIVATLGRNAANYALSEAANAASAAAGF